MSQTVYTGGRGQLEGGEQVLIEREDGQRFRLVLVEPAKPKRKLDSAEGLAVKLWEVSQ